MKSELHRKGCQPVLRQCQPLRLESCLDIRARQAVFRKEYPRFAHQLGEGDLAALRPGVMCASHHEERIAAQRVRRYVIDRHRLEESSEQQIDAALWQCPELLFSRLCRDDVDGNVRILT